MGNCGVLPLWEVRKQTVLEVWYGKKLCKWVVVRNLMPTDGECLETKHQTRQTIASGRNLFYSAPNLPSGSSIIKPNGSKWAIYTRVSSYWRVNWWTWPLRASFFLGSSSPMSWDRRELSLRPDPTSLKYHRKYRSHNSTPIIWADRLDFARILWVLVFCWYIDVCDLHAWLYLVGGLEHFCFSIYWEYLIIPIG